jgi:hypothetical protein
MKAAQLPDAMYMWGTAAPSTSLKAGSRLSGRAKLDLVFAHTRHIPLTMVSPLQSPAARAPSPS